MESKKSKNKVRSKVLNRLSVPNVIIVGGTASGKSTVGYQLAKVLELGVVDIDDEIERVAAKPIHEIFRDEGEVGFRDQESAIIKSLTPIRNHVIITGAGAIERDENWETLGRLGPIVWLATPAAEVARRLVMKHDELSKRPLLAEAVRIEDRVEREKYLTAKLDEMMERRRHRYEGAELTLSCSYVTAETCAQFIKSMLLDNKLNDDKAR
ncbi:shikimate kinase [Pseudobacteriovorax antillogorgiicola]|uniref:Shikimate kinase n=1 Tax=Pseudobacteriovorax antillogorgiicola TaxID=1513793 RepID=A0A1Y6BBT4_9BACT|nr:shikimate kinase [Pseudobacteriovorax antillogorgiicola]TCS58720.1 shikimate kinase [Pseudobacteriovorax antillogorgiicola]SME95386.1 shikimate kinase [Pseudobacteriovorax antillogorgiicola]